MRASPVMTPAAAAPPHSSYIPWAAYALNSKNDPGSTSRLIRSRAVRRPLLCWLSIALGPPPSRIFSSSFRTCETRSARKRMLASKRADVGSIWVSRTVELEGVPGSMRSLMSGGLKEFTVYQRRGTVKTAVFALRTTWFAISDCRFLISDLKIQIDALRRLPNYLSPTIVPDGSRLLQAGSCRSRNTLQRCDGIPDRAPPGESIASPPGIG